MLVSTCLLSDVATMRMLAAVLPLGLPL